MSNDSDNDIVALLNVMLAQEVDFLVIGGVAAVLHGAPVVTFDVDLLFDVNPVNADRLAQALRSVNARFREHKDLKPSSADVRAGGHLLCITDHGPLDVLGSTGKNRTYNDLARNSKSMTIADLSVKIIGLDDLIAVKREVGRQKDLAALPILEALRNRKP